MQKNVDEKNKYESNLCVCNEIFGVWENIEKTKLSFFLPADRNGIYKSINHWMQIWKQSQFTNNRSSLQKFDTNMKIINWF